MSRKSRRGHKPRSPKAPAAASRPTEAIAEQAAAALAGGHFKEAITQYKTLRKREPQQLEWRQGLEQAYAGRARELASKAMWREALVIWEQRAQACEAPLLHPDYLRWMMAAGHLEKAARLFREQGAGLDRKQQGALREAFAARALGGESSIIEALGPEDPVAKDFEAADQALRAYCAGEDDTMDAALKGLPFRSPYRALRQALGALQRFETSPVEAAEQLQQVPEDSPFAALCQPLRGALGPLHTLIANLPHYSPPALDLLGCLAGWSAEQVKLTKEAAKLWAKRAKAGDKQLFDLILRHRALFGDALAQRFAWRLLVHYHQGKRAYEQAFGWLDPFAEAQLDAVRTEFVEKALPFDMVDDWDDALDALQEESETDRTRLRQAVLMRHIYDLELREGDHDPQMLEQSLELDPTDIPTWVRAIDDYRTQKDLKSARRCLDRALEQFPDEPMVLQAAVETAVAGGAYKKAARFAHKLLKKDPINPKVKATLLDAHLAHARKQIRGHRRANLVEKELEAALQWATSSRDRARVELLRGLRNLESEGAAAGSGPIQGAVEALGGGLAGRFALLLEARRLGLQPNTLLKTVGLKLTRDLAKKPYVLELVHTLSELPERDHGHAKAALSILAGPIEKAAAANYSQAERERVCEIWFRFRALGLLESYALQALEQGLELPIFEFFWVYGKYRGKSLELSYQDQHLCELAMDNAREQGDRRTAIRIADWLNGSPPIPNRGGRGGRPKLFDMDESPIEMEIIIGSMALLALQMGGVDQLFAKMRQDGEDEALIQLEQMMGKDTLRLLLEKMMNAMMEQTDGGNPFLPPAPPPAKPKTKPKPRPRKQKKPPPPDDEGPLQGDLL